mmetsp:Transcript_68605/g.146861  ORF Transcript_68605/g.146861 Transcript_68605/m.146861 type:complete len:184 (+) Transcript_68605:92-643(+)
MAGWPRWQGDAARRACYVEEEEQLWKRPRCGGTGQAPALVLGGSVHVRKQRDASPRCFSAGAGGFGGKRKRDEWQDGESCRRRRRLNGTELSLLGGARVDFEDELYSGAHGLLVQQILAVFLVTSAVGSALGPYLAMYLASWATIGLSLVLGGVVVGGSVGLSAAAMVMTSEMPLLGLPLSEL